MTRVLIVRPDGMGDVLLAGPAVRAVAANAERVTMLCSPSGAAAADRLPGVDDVIVERLPWIDAEPERIDDRVVTRITRRLRDAGCDEAIVLTSFHQCPLPTALLLRAAGVARIGAISDDYPGALLDIRHVVTDDIHEVERALSLVEAMGYRLPPGDDGLLRVPTTARPLRHVVVHPGASAPARTMSRRRWREIAAGLAFAGHRVVVTGAPAEAALVRSVAGAVGDPHVTRDLDELVEILEAATAVVVGNTGPAHLAAALGRPVVSCYPPTVPSVRWHPWGVPCVLLGDQSVPCAGCRARTCPQSRQWCVDRVTAADVVAAVDRVAGDVAQVGVA